MCLGAGWTPQDTDVLRSWLDTARRKENQHSLDVISLLYDVLDPREGGDGATRTDTFPAEQRTANRADIHIPALEGRICLGLSSDGGTCGFVGTCEERAQDLPRNEHCNQVVDVLRLGTEGAVDPTRVFTLYKKERDYKQG